MKNIIGWIAVVGLAIFAYNEWKKAKSKNKEAKRV